jgi:EAL domain-containing protein (putative c-di-GMP-specific phosphodiesterase class I)
VEAERLEVAQDRQRRLAAVEQHLLGDLVTGLGCGAQNAAIIRAVIDIARALGMRTTAEGVDAKTGTRRPRS